MSNMKLGKQVISVLKETIYKQADELKKDLRKNPGKYAVMLQEVAKKAVSLIDIDFSNRSAREQVYSELAELLSDEVEISEKALIAWMNMKIEDKPQLSNDQKHLAEKADEALKNKDLVLRCEYEKNGSEYQRTSEAYVRRSDGNVEVLSSRAPIGIDHLPGPAVEALIVNGEETIPLNLLS